MQRLWRARVRAGELHQQVAALFRPSRLRYIAHSWPFRPDVCPCDVHLCDYLDERTIRGRTVFHFGTGGHHLVGRSCATSFGCGAPNPAGRCDPD